MSKRIQVGDLRTDKRISNLLLAFTNKDYIADKIMPSITVGKRTGLIPVLGNSHLRIYDSVRSTYDESSHRMKFEISDDKNYKIENYDQELYLPDELIEEQELPFNIRRDAQFVLKEAMMLEREKALADLFSNTAAITQNVTLSGTSQWSDYANSNPEDDVELARDTIHDAIGREANSMYISRKGFNKLKYHPLFLNRVSGVKVLDGKVLEQMIKDLFEVENLYKGGLIHIPTKEGQTETKLKVWQDDAVLFYRAPRPSIYTPSFGYNFVLPKNQLSASNRREPNADEGVLEKIKWSRQDKILQTEAIYLIKDIV